MSHNRKTGWLSLPVGFILMVACQVLSPSIIDPTPAPGFVATAAALTVEAQFTRSTGPTLPLTASPPAIHTAPPQVVTVSPPSEPAGACGQSLPS
jgi:hypothetical protein